MAKKGKLSKFAAEEKEESSPGEKDQTTEPV